MPIPTDPNISEVKAEFGPNSLPFDPDSFFGMYSKVLGSTTGGSPKDFAGLGKATIGSVSFGATDSKIDVTIPVDRVGTEISLQAEYSKSSNFSGSTITNPVTYTTDPNQGIAVITLSPVDSNSTYYIRVFYWNNFNNNDKGVYTTSTTTQDPRHPKPVVDSVGIRLSPTYTDRVDVFPIFDYGDEPASISDWAMQYGVRTSTLQYQAVIYSSSNLGTTNNPKRLYATKDGDFDRSNLSEGDLIYLTIGASASNGNADSPDSDVKSGEVRALSPPSRPVVVQPDLSSPQVTASWNHGSFGSNSLTRFVWRVNGSTTIYESPPRGANSISRTFSYGDSVEASIRYDEGQVMNWSGYGGSVTVQEASPDPTSVTLFESGAFSQVTWDTPEKGNPIDYDILVYINGIGYFVVGGLAGSTTSHSFDICQYGSNNDTAYVRVDANYSNETGRGDSSQVTIINCAGGGGGIV